MRARACLRCKVVVTMPDGKEYPAFFTASMVKKSNRETWEQSFARQLSAYRNALCGRFGGQCKVKVIEPCDMARECNG